MSDRIVTKHHYLCGDIASAIVTFRVSERVKEDLIKKATDEGFTLSSYLNLLVNDILDNERDVQKGESRDNN